MKKIFGFGMLVAIIALSTVLMAATFRPYDARGILEVPTEVVKVYNGYDAPLEAGNAVIRDITETYLGVTLGDSATAQYLFYGVAKTACDTDGYVNVVIYGDAEATINASQSDTTTDGGLPIVLGDNGNFDVIGASDWSDTESSDRVIGLNKRILGYTLEAVGSNSEATITVNILKH